MIRKLLEMEGFRDSYHRPLFIATEALANGAKVDQDIKKVIIDKLVALLDKSHNIRTHEKVIGYLGMMNEIGLLNKLVSDPNINLPNKIQIGKVFRDLGEFESMRSTFLSLGLEMSRTHYYDLMISETLYSDFKLLYVMHILIKESDSPLDIDEEFNDLIQLPPIEYQEDAIDMLLALSKNPNLNYALALRAVRALSDMKQSNALLYFSKQPLGKKC